MHYLYRYVCILNVFFIYVNGQLSAIKSYSTEPITRTDKTFHGNIKEPRCILSVTH